jgi:hypothetical protein
LLPLALLISFGIVAIYFLLRRLFDGTTAAVAATLLALSPYYLAQSKILHLDAWMATLMLTSALALLLYCRERNVGWLALAAVLGGLALLVKPTALFLVPYCGLVLLVYAIRDTQHEMRERASPIAYGVWRIAARRLLGPLAVWLLIVAVVYFALWPAMWVDPQRALKAVVEGGLLRHIGTAHDTPTYFLGQVTYGDPGLSFYAVSMLLRTGEVELLFSIVAIVLGAFHVLRHRRISQRGMDYLLLLAYVVFFLAQMSLGAKKMPRYVLPAILALDVLAAAGIVAWARALAGERRRMALILMALPLLIQAVLILPRHPYYGTAANWIAGGPQAAARAILTGEEGEGLADVAGYLNDRSDVEDLAVAAQLKHVLNQYFRGSTLDIDEQPADYVVFHRNYVVRDFKLGMWEASWERYAARTAEREVGFDGVPYAWLYPVVSAGARPEHQREAHIGDSFGFLGYDLRSMEVAPGDRVPVVLYWKAAEQAQGNLSIFFHLLAPDGSLIWQEDGGAAHGERPVHSWVEGEMIVDPHTIVLPHDLPPGDYRLVAGLYDWQTGERLPVIIPDDVQTPADHVEVATLQVGYPGTQPTAWGARGLAGLVLVSALVTVWRSDTDE